MPESWHQNRDNVTRGAGALPTLGADAFVGKRKDHRFYELVEDTVRQGSDYKYFAIKDRDGEVQKCDSVSSSFSLTRICSPA